MEFPGYHKMKLRELQLMQLDVMQLIHDACIKHGLNYYMIAGSVLGAVRHGGFIPWDDDIDIALMRRDYEEFKKVFQQEFDKSKYFLQYYETDVDHRPALMRLCIKGTIQDLPYEYHLRNCKNTYIDIFPLDNVPDDANLRKEHSAKNQKYGDMLITKLYVQKISPRQCLHPAIVFKFLWAKIHPLKSLQKAKERVMRKYEKVETKCVCSMESHYSYEKQTMDRRIYGTPTLLKFENRQFFVPEHYIEYLEKLYGKNYMQLPPEEKREKPYDVYIID